RGVAPSGEDQGHGYGRRARSRARPTREGTDRLMLKDHACGELRADHAGVEVRIAGWVNAHRDHGGVLFIDLRDSSGVVQVVCEAVDAHRLRDEWCVAFTG